MFAETEDLNIFDDDQLIVSLVEDRIIHDILYILLISLRKEQHSFGVSFRRTQESLTIRIFADAFEDRSDGASELLQPCLGLFGSLFFPFSGSQT